MPTKKTFLTRSEYAVAVAFEALMAASDNECPSNSEIAEAAEVSTYTVSFAMKRLVKLGYYGHVRGRYRSYSILKSVPRRKSAA